MGNISELFWLFFILSFLQPVIRQKLLNLRRMKVLTALEKSRGTRVISLIHRQETMALLGFPVMRYIDIQDSEEILRAIELTDAEWDRVHAVNLIAAGTAEVVEHLGRGDGLARADVGAGDGEGGLGRAVGRRHGRRQGDESKGCAGEGQQHGHPAVLRHGASSRGTVSVQG